ERQRDRLVDSLDHVQLGGQGGAAAGDLGGDREFEVVEAEVQRGGGDGGAIGGQHLERAVLGDQRTRVGGDVGDAVDRLGGETDRRGVRVRGAHGDGARGEQGGGDGGERGELHGESFSWSVRGHASSRRHPGRESVWRRGG